MSDLTSGLLPAPFDDGFEPLQLLAQLHEFDGDEIYYNDRQLDENICKCMFGDCALCNQVDDA